MPLSNLKGLRLKNRSSFIYPLLLCLGLLPLLTACQPNDSELLSLLAEQEERLQRLEDIEAIGRLERAYGYYVDKHLWDQVVDLFAEESSVEISQRGVFLNKEGVQTAFLGRMG